MMNLNYIPVSIIDTVWPLIDKGLSNIAKKIGQNGVSNKEFFVELKMNPSLLLYLVEEDKKYMGFFIALLKNQQKEFCIYKGYHKPGVKKLTPEFWQQIAELAKEYGCDKVSFYSTRRGWKRQAIKYGFKEETVQYTRRI